MRKGSSYQELFFFLMDKDLSFINAIFSLCLTYGKIGVFMKLIYTTMFLYMEAYDAAHQSSRGTTNDRFI
jgi:hypothetical protein